MRKRIRSSLSIKVFLWVFCALMVCCIGIYGIVIAVVPRNYQTVSDSQFDNNVSRLFLVLESRTYDEAVDEIYNFCIENNAAVMLERNNETINFGDFERIGADASAASTYTTSLRFQGENEEQILSVIAMSRTANEFYETLLRFIPAILGIVVILSALSSFICSRVIAAPVSKISRISKRMTGLDMTWHCDIDRDDEIGVLASSLNTMAEKLNATLAELKKANEQLQLDMKNFRKIEQQRKDFFTAVSHELKTPLTILKGQIENMLYGYGDYKNHEKYLPQALKTTGELEHLVREILSIVKMENMSINDSLECVSLNKMLRQLIREMTPLAAQKNIRIHQDAEGDVTVAVNPELFQKALSNIIGNAVSYSPDNAEIFVVLKAEDSGHLLKIENTGVFLPEETKDRLFTPFYKIDKSRNKAAGGTGLGLYLVKTILELHEMEYRICNTDKGVAFFLKLNS